MRSYSVPKTFEEFEQLCVDYLRREWNRPGLARYAKSGYAQHGVDIVDTANADDCWAAQCKLHESGKALQAAEILAEVAMADSFPLTIRRYAVCTTGKKTPHAVETIAKLNAARRAVGKFAVELIYWEDIELKLDQEDEFRERYLVSSHASVRAIVHSEIEQGMARGIAPIKTQLNDLVGDVREAGLSALDSELDRAKRLLDAHEYSAAEALLRDLKATKYDRLTPLQRFRCLANLGFVEHRIGNDVAAGELLLKAAEEYPEHEKALANRAHGYNLLGNHDEAWQAIKAALAAKKDDRQIIAAYVAYAPADHAVDNLTAEVGSAISDPRVVLAFADRSLRADNYSETLTFIEQLKELGNETYDSRFIEARAIVEPHLPEDPRDVVDDPFARRRIEVGLSLLEQASREAEQAKDLRTALSARLAHAQFVGLLRDEDQTERSLEEATRLATGYPRALAGIDVMRSQLALSQGRHERALHFAARALKFDDNVDAGMLRAVAFLNRNQGADRENARRELRKLLPRLGGPHLEQALNIMVTDLLAQRRREAALDAVQQAAAVGIDRACSLAQEARIAIAQDDQERAGSLAKEAAAALNEASTGSTRRMAVSLLRQLNDLHTALDAHLPLASKTVLTSDTKTFLAVAMEAKRDDLVIEWCADLWANHALDAAARWNYLYLLDQYDPNQALQKTEDAVATESDPQELGALKARRAIRQRRLGRIVTNIEVADIPSATTTALHYVGLFIEALLVAGLRSEAVDYAYRCVLRFPDEPVPHAALIQCFLFERDTDQPLVTVPEVVKVGVAVEIQEGDAHPTWYTIEDEYVAGLPDVVPATEPWAARLLGARSGDLVALAGGVIASRTVVVKTIEAAAVHRYRDSLHTWQMRFPEQPLLEEHQLKTDPVTGEFDFAPLLNMLKAQVENVKRLDEFYRGGAVPISLMAEKVGRPVFQTMEHLTRDDDLFVNCVYADDATFQQAAASLASARGIVLDGTAIWTLREIGAIDVLETLPFAFGTVQQSFDSVQKEYTSELDAREGGVLSLDGDRLALREIPSDMRQQHRASWREVGASLAKGQTLSSESLAALPTERREQLLSIAGAWSAHAMAAAKQHGFVLWSDDRVLEFLGKEFFAVPRVWTQAVLRWLESSGRIDDVRMRQASAKLQAYRYSGTFVDAGVLVQAAKLAEWKLASPVLQHNFRVLGAPTTDQRACVSMALGLIAACMADVRFSTTQTIIITSILDRLKARDRSLRIVQHVFRMIPLEMRLNPFGARQASEIVAMWLRANQGVLAP